MSIRRLLALVSLGVLAACGGATAADGSPAFQAATLTAPPASTFAAAPATSTGTEATDSALPPAADEPPATFIPDHTTTTTVVYDLPNCPDAPRGAVADKANQRYWLCAGGAAVTDEIPMTTASANYGLPPIGTYEVFARDENAFGIGGEALERFVAFYTTSKGNRIAFHEVVNQDPDTVGDLDKRGESAGCFRVREDDSVEVWEFLQLGDPVVIMSN